MNKKNIIYNNRMIITSPSIKEKKFESKYNIEKNIIKDKSPKNNSRNKNKKIN